VPLKVVLEVNTKFGVNLMVWTTRVSPQHEPLLRRIREWGFDGAELFLSPTEPVRIQAVKQILDSAGLDRTTCSVLPRAAHLPSLDPEMRGRAVRFLQTCVERTADLGATLVCGPLYAGLGVMTRARRTVDEWKWAVDGLGKVARRGRELGVTLCIEPLNRFETYFLNTQADAFDLVKELGNRTFAFISTPFTRTSKNGTLRRLCKRSRRD
jgi:D-psicose/D-tagatose/L-ribulose 3-epimerase